MDRPLGLGPAGDRQRGILAARQRLEVGAVLAQDRQRLRGVDRAAVARDDVVGLLDQPSSRFSVAIYAAIEPPSESIGISTGER